MNAFNGDQQLKDELIAKLKHHQELDAFVRGGWLTDEKVEDNGFKGCFYGCTMQTDDSPREKFSELYKIDLWYCYLTERIFEGLPDWEFQSFPVNSVEVVPVGFDFNKIKSEWFRLNLLKQLDWIHDDTVRKVLIDTAKLFEVPFNEIDKDAALAAAWSAAWSAESAARSAESAAESAESNHYVWMRDTLFELIRNN